MADTTDLSSGSGLLPIIPSLIGGLANLQNEQAAQQARQAALNNIMGINTPNMSYNFNPYQVSGQLTPIQEQALQQGQSATNNIQTNPTYLNAANNALSNLQGIANQGGLTLTDKANLNNIQNQTGAQMSGAMGAIQQNMAARGLGGSGLELAQKMGAAQNSMNQANTQGTNIAGQAQQNALNALSGAGNLGAGLQAQQFGQQFQQGQAQNLINQFNTQNAQNVAGYNAQLGNQAQLYNTQNAQNVANMNTQGMNQQQLQNNIYQQQQYQDQLNRATAGAGVVTGQNGIAQGYQNIGSTISGGLGQVGQGLAQYGASQPSSSNSSTSGTSSSDGSPLSSYSTGAPNMSNYGNSVPQPTMSPLTSFLQNNQNQDY